MFSVFDKLQFRSAVGLPPIQTGGVLETPLRDRYTPNQLDVQAQCNRMAVVYQ